MKPKEFEEQTVIIGASQSEYGNLPAKVETDPDRQSLRVETQWELSDDELIDLAKTRTVIIQQFMPTNQLYNPISVEVKKRT